MAASAKSGPARGADVLVWLRRAFRLHDNPVLHAAAAAVDGQPARRVLAFRTVTGEDSVISERRNV